MDYSIALTVACIRGPSFRLAVLTKISGFKGYRFSLLAAMVAVCKEIESFQKNLKSQEIPDMYMGKLDHSEIGSRSTRISMHRRGGKNSGGHKGKFVWKKWVNFLKHFWWILVDKHLHENSTEFSWTFFW